MLSNFLRLRAILAAMIALLVATSFATWYAGRFVLQANQEVIVQQTLIGHLDRTLQLMIDAETGQRGYIITGEESYLEPYHDALTNIESQLLFLREQADAGKIEPADVAELKRLVGGKREWLDRAIEARRQGSLVEAVNIVRTGGGKRVMDEIRTVIARVRSHQSEVLQNLQARSDRRTMVRTSLFLGSGAAELVFCIWAYRRIVRGIQKAELASAETRRQKDLLAVTLESIGDAVMVTDTQARVTFMNPVAEKLTGWTLGEALGRPISEVFRIINEDSRQAVDNPVNKVLRLGKIVGLANHTLLVRRDKTETPIDDSGAPIRDEQGKIYGAVLVFRDFSAHKAAEHQLLAAKAEAEAANRAKDQFLATLSHELRTPLTPVVATLNIWESNAAVPAELRADVQMIRRNIDLEARLIDDMLDLTRIARGKLSLNLERVDFHELLNAAVEIVRTDIDAKKLVLTAGLHATRHFVYGDSARLQQILWNVLKNAVKFTDEGGSIHVETDDEAERIRMRVRDSGIGMTAETLGRLFRPFEQGAEDTMRRFGGLGLGMAISKALVDAQGGKITAESAGAGQGSVFTVWFPTVAAPATPAASAPATLSPAGHRRLRILLVEDHSDTARAMQRILAGLGHEVHLAHSVQGAMASINEGSFDLLLSDIGLPDGSGLDVIRYLHTLRAMPAVALTGFGMEDDIARCRQAGFAAHLTKPVNIQKLQATIQQVTEEGK